MGTRQTVDAKSAHEARAREDGREAAPASLRECPSLPVCSLPASEDRQKLRRVFLRNQAAILSVAVLCPAIFSSFFVPNGGLQPGACAAVEAGTRSQAAFQFAPAADMAAEDEPAAETVADDLGRKGKWWWHYSAIRQQPRTSAGRARGAVSSSRGKNLKKKLLFMALGIAVTAALGFVSVKAYKKWRSLKTKRSPCPQYVTSTRS
ncbi:hypothetical protein BESB_084750 [Besnoitia besnoiti]|uniref:Transmembrane protein n=1 Tax=Besnoitia besnoiti TaxID=94643 RepID=A0A2A9MBH6_BESBE|nr:hypothetical protein BESB_084750 [Besnoitia besnoiti]PFH33276.1 hypothetical protein BESB_084750 [Besnoitia besnoiti]